MNRGDFGELTAFMAVFEASSFRGAARRLNVTPSALSRTLNRLERRIGVRLLNRTTRSVSPTEAGELLYARLGPALSGLEEAVGDVAALRESPVGMVRLNLPRLAAELILLPRMAQFHELNPGIRLNLMIDDDLSDVVAAGCDAGIRMGELLAQDMIAIRLTDPFRVAVVGAPSYFARHPRPETPRDLRNHECIVYRWASSGRLHRWQFDDASGSVDVAVEGPLLVNDTSIIRDAAIAGMGLAYLPETSVATQIASGTLVRVLEAWCKPLSGFYLYHPSRRQTPPPLRALISFLKGDIVGHPPAGSS
ncbi:LysR family transcriptional regulator [Ochrobactrum sp. MYb15]|uniref:LysR family transcriptional regulator n=1 Tax=Brucella pituitosa TaxID=571256 RepID=A0ABS3K5P5_9HYPH|nr:LysR family transcriptional regulator [Brucella pituitosa]PQZ47550.1 LysR family transcriptional regulator [Ochrobactrum sp. MYb19]PRA63226.1 LysR family transcriptional regulator [Ochrobactrum sp. MYb18]PRA73420.1 LysR family transcriptional regulator [Brucella thiophenivorans]PRA88222.1 LysR family transcriptional regulator [Ochrobactrum sp. MYb14]PRA94943.1 LysR family transcriptional regulator [Ochrobactrum sp. MYb15]